MGNYYFAQANLMESEQSFSLLSILRLRSATQLDKLRRLCTLVMLSIARVHGRKCLHS